MRFAIGDILADYVVVAVLGEGGMGAVYRAVHQRTGQKVALKVMFDEACARRFRLESQALTSLRHPGIPEVYDVGETPVFYYAQEIIEGPSLEVRLAEPIGPEEALSLCLSLLDVLGAVHSRGGVHRDVNPRNILLREGQPCLIDFGLIRLLDSGGGLTTSGEVLGTPQYMAPEQIDSTYGPICPGTDLFATATVLYRMLAGRLPTEPGSYPRIMRQVVTSPPPPLADCCEALAAVVMKGLAKRTSDRFATAEEFSAALRAAYSR